MGFFLFYIEVVGARVLVHAPVDRWRFSGNLVNHTFRCRKRFGVIGFFVFTSLVTAGFFISRTIFRSN